MRPTSNKLVHLENYFLARCRSAVCVVYLFIFFSAKTEGELLFVRCLTITLSGRGHFYLEMNIPAKPAMFPCVKEGRVPKWANATGRRCKMSTLLYHPLEIDCITSRNVAPRINRDALFQDRRWWAQSAGWTLPLSLLLGTTDNAWKNLLKTTVSSLQDISIFNS